jgi:hypothetical protein
MMSKLSSPNKLNIGIALFLGLIAVRIFVWDNDRIRFYLVRFQYDSEVNREIRDPLSRHPVLLVWGWSDSGGAGVTNVFSRLVYDESDQVASTQRSAEWWASEKKWDRSVHEFDEAISSGQMTGERLFVDKIAPHYYIMSTVWP